MRSEDRKKALAIRKTIGGWKCDLCKGVHQTLDMHEIFSRGFTSGNEEARTLSYQVELCSFLCRECHDYAPRIAGKLIELNCKRYGKMAVLRKVVKMGQFLGKKRVKRWISIQD